jgi:hypothetical protein
MLVFHLVDPGWRPPFSLCNSSISLIAVFLPHFGSVNAPILSEYIRTSHLLIGFRYYFINWTQMNQTNPPNLAPSPDRTGPATRARLDRGSEESRSVCELLGQDPFHSFDPVVRTSCNSEGWVSFKTP